jgi:pimeloyl-ACP methyl ester carboxylesterase
LLDVLQTSFIFPGRHWQGSADVQVRPGPGEELIPLKTSRGTAIMGLFSRASTKPRGTILYFYGNAECIAFARPIAALFRTLGYHCMLVDFPGFGLSSGEPSEQGCYDAAEAAFAYLKSRPGIDPARLIAAGWSLGGAVAIELAHRHEKHLRGLMTFSTFDSMIDFAQRQYPFLPVSYFLTHRFDSAEKVRQLSLPYFVAHGQCDSLIPVSNAHRLAAVHGRTQMVTTCLCPDADHIDFFEAGGKQLLQEMAAFLERVTTGPAISSPA